MTSLTEFFNKHEDDALKGISHKNSIIKRNIIAYMAVNGECTLSELTKELHISVPTITKLVQELEERNLLVKQADEKDKRVINLTLTEEGKEFVELRVTHFHGEWASRLPDLDDTVVDEFVHAITRMQETMPGIKGVKNNGKRK